MRSGSSLFFIQKLQRTKNWYVLSSLPSFLPNPSCGPMHITVLVHESKGGSEKKTTCHMPIPPPPPPPHPTHTHTHTHTHTQRTIKLGMYLSLFINPILALVSMCFSFVRNISAVSTLTLVFFYPIGTASFIVRIIFYIKHSMCTCTINNPHLPGPCNANSTCISYISQRLIKQPKVAVVNAPSLWPRAYEHHKAS